MFLSYPSTINTNHAPISATLAGSIASLPSPPIYSTLLFPTVSNIFLKKYIRWLKNVREFFKDVILHFGYFIFFLCCLVGEFLMMRCQYHDVQSWRRYPTRYQIKKKTFKLISLVSIKVLAGSRDALNEFLGTMILGGVAERLLCLCIRLFSFFLFFYQINQCISTICVSSWAADLPRASQDQISYSSSLERKGAGGLGEQERPQAIRQAPHHCVYYYLCGSRCMVVVVVVRFNQTEKQRRIFPKCVLCQVMFSSKILSRHL